MGPHGAPWGPMGPHGVPWGPSSAWNDGHSRGGQRVSLAHAHVFHQDPGPGNMGPGPYRSGLMVQGHDQNKDHDKRRDQK